ncbi:unnamed protein product [Closterium sp. NIES-53]
MVDRFPVQQRPHHSSTAERWLANVASRWRANTAARRLHRLHPHDSSAPASQHPRRPAKPRRPTEPHCPARAAPAATIVSAATAATAAMASPTVLTFDAEGRAVHFDVWVDDLQLFLQCDSKDGVSLFDHTSGVSPTPAATADSTVCSQWTTRDAVARLAVRIARNSSPGTAALSRLTLPYLFPDLAAFTTVADLITHLRTSDARYSSALPSEFYAKNPPPMYITLYYLVTRLPDSLALVRDHFLCCAAPPPRRPAKPRRPTKPHCPACAAPATTAVSAATAATVATAATAAIASPTVLTFDAEERAVDFDVWVDDLQLFLQCDSKDGVSLFDHMSSVSRAPAATADSTVRSQWTTHDAVARLAVPRYSSPATAALSHLMLPYLFPDLAAFAIVADLISNLRTSDARYRAALPTELYAKNPPPPCISPFTT